MECVGWLHRNGLAFASSQAAMNQAKPEHPAQLIAGMNG
jgi:hypothetical protein